MFNPLTRRDQIVAQINALQGALAMLNEIYPLEAKTPEPVPPPIPEPDDDEDDAKLQ